MKNRKRMEKIISAFIITMMLCTVVVPVFAKEVGGVSIDPTTPSNSSDMESIGNTILGAIQLVGTIVAVGILMVLGIKYMMGSAEEKAEYKKTMIPYLVGAILLFAAVNIAAGVVNMINDF